VVSVGQKIDVIMYHLLSLISSVYKFHFTFFAVCEIKQLAYTRLCLMQVCCECGTNVDRAAILFTHSSEFYMTSPASYRLSFDKLD